MRWESLKFINILEESDLNLLEFYYPFPTFPQGEGDHIKSGNHVPLGEIRKGVNDINR